MPLADDDGQPLLDALRVCNLAGQQRLAPTVDGGQGGAQLVGDGGDELGLHFVVLTDLLGHLVDGGGQLPDLVVVFRLDLNPIAARGDALGSLRDAGHGLHDGADKIQVGHIHHGHRRQTHPQGDEDEQQKLMIHQLQTGHQPHDPFNFIPVEDGGGHRHDALSRGRVLPRPGGDLLMLDGRGDVRRVWTAAGGEAVGGQDDLTGGVDELQFQGFLLVEVVDVVVGHLQIHLLRRGVVGEEVADRSGLGLHGGADAVVVVVTYKD